MIQEVIPELHGVINSVKEELHGTINYTKEYVYPELQEKTITPTKEGLTVKADENYYGLSKVIVEPIEKIKPTVLENTLVYRDDMAHMEGNEMVIW